MYAEVMIAINTLFNFSMLSFANKVCTFRIRFKRLLFSSVIGGIIVTIFTNSPIVILVSFITMTLCAFGWRIADWKRGAALSLVATLFAGGLLTAIYPMLSSISSTYFIMLACVLVYIGLHSLQKRWIDTKVNAFNVQLTHPSVLSVFGTEVPLTIFIDTGNTSVEPLSNSPVHFIAFDSIKHAMSEDLIQSLYQWDQGDPFNLTQFPEQIRPKIRLIKLSTVQKKDSWAIAFRYDEWKIGSEHPSTMMPGYFVLTKNHTKFPKDADAILQVSALTILKTERGKDNVS